MISAPIIEQVNNINKTQGILWVKCYRCHTVAHIPSYLQGYLAIIHQSLA